MDRFWLITWTTYGTWLPGDERGFVSAVREPSGERVIHNVPGTEYDRDNVGLRRYSQRQMTGPRRFLNAAQARAVGLQLRETARQRGWEILALAIMSNHVHVVVGVPGDPDPAGILRDLKSYASRALNARPGVPVKQKWWTASGSRRKLSNKTALRAAIKYVERQAHAHVIWTHRSPGS